MAEEGVSNSDYVKKDFFSNVEEGYFDCAANIRDYLDQLRGAPPAIEYVSTHVNHSHSQVSKLVQLAKISLPTFDGDWLNWPSFKSLFELLVHKDMEIPKPFKLQQLLSHVSGEAAAMLENVDVSDEGYDGAWKDLIDCYENQHLLLCKYMRCIFDCAAVARSSATELKRITSIFKCSRRAFIELKRPVESWSDWFLFLCLEKLDNATKMFWQTSLRDNKRIPTFDDLLKFLECRIQALMVTYGQVSKPIGSSASSANRPSNNGQKSTVALNTTAQASNTKNKVCPLCQKGQSIGFCAQFKALAINDRWAKARSLKLCTNCFSPKHFVKTCKSQVNCRINEYNKRHHFLLHQSSGLSVKHCRKSDDFKSSSDSQVDNTAETSQVSAYTATTSHRTVVLDTAKVIIENSVGEKMTVRALPDHAAESSFITERVTQLLKLNRSCIAIQTSGLQGAATGEAKISAQIKLRSPLDNQFAIMVNTLILPSLTDLVPSIKLKRQRWRHLEGLSLADPDFALPGKVDVILGADVYGAIINGAKRSNAVHEQTAISTVFGWIIVGNLGGNDPPESSTQILHCATRSLSDQLQKFWELEEVSAKDSSSPSDTYCEEQFTQTHPRDTDGRFIVRLPVSSNESITLGNN